jgi:hypothetical protein
VPSSFEQLYFALLCAVERRSSKRPVVVVDAAAGEFDRLAVQKQALFCRPRERSDPEGREHFIDNPAVLQHSRDYAVQNRRADQRAGLATAIS